MSYLRGPDRTQVQLLPACLDDYVAANAPARFIDAFVEGLDFRALSFTRAVAKGTGRPCYHPADLLKLYLYGYLQRVRSSRRLEAEACRNLEVMWLLRGVRPDFKTIADFRKDNRAAFKPLFKQFNLLCRKLDLFGAELVAIDGSKFKAVNNVRRHYTQEQLQELTEKIESRIEEYLGELDRQDEDTQGVAEAPSSQELQEKITQLKEHQGHYQGLLDLMRATGQNEVSLTDSDSRKMKGAHGEHFIGYNVQTAVDARHDLIVTQDVVATASDRNQLHSMALAAKAELEVPTLRVVADKGYHQADQLEACEQAGVETYVPAQGTTSGRSKDGRKVFPKEQFRYDGQADVYHCPGGQQLARGSQTDGRVSYSNRAACRDCPLRSQCTSAKYRKIERRINEEVVERAAQRVAAHPELVSQRKTIVEHVFGTLRTWHHDAFLLIGLEKVRAEMSLSALTYNLRRVLSLRTVEELLTALGLSCNAQPAAV